MLYYGVTQPTPSQPDPRAHAVSGRLVLAVMAGLAVVFVVGLYAVVTEVPPYDPQPATTLRRIHEAQVRYRDSDPDADGADYASLDELAEWQLVDPGVGQGTRAGYHFLVRPLEDGWIGAASPVKPGESGDRYYAIDARGVVVWSADAPFPLDTPLPPDAAELPADAAR